MAIRPLGPVTDRHLLVLPRLHVPDAADPDVTAATVERAAQLADAYRLADPTFQFNLITSAGSAATQTVFHLHIHLVPRRRDDGLHLPWTGQHAQASPHRS